MPKTNCSRARVLIATALSLLLTACACEPPRTSTPPAAAPSPAIPPLPASARQLPRSETHSAEVARSLDALLPTPTKPVPAGSSASRTTSP